MAFIAVIHIDTDHTADALDYTSAPLPPGARWVGLFQYPHYRKDLKCPGTCVRKGSGAWGRDPLGFVRCSICGSRNRKVRQWLISHIFDLLGANIYPQAPAAFRTPEGYGIVRGQ